MLRKNDADLDYRQRYCDRLALGFKKTGCRVRDCSGILFIKGWKHPCGPLKGTIKRYSGKPDLTSCKGYLNYTYEVLKTSQELAGGRERP